MKTLEATLALARALGRASTMKTSRSFQSFFGDRFCQSITQATLMDAMEHLARSLDSSLEYVGQSKLANFIAASTGEDAPRALHWMRKHPRVSAMLALMSDDKEFSDAVRTIELPEVVEAAGAAAPKREGDVNLEVHCLSPLSHGSDGKSGNATVFRRRQVMSPSGGVLELPIYAGNALRGQLRDMLADHFLFALGLQPDRAHPPVALWFFHALYSGGVLEEAGKAGKAVSAALGASGVTKVDGVAQLRCLVSPLSLLGVAIGNRILSGRINVGDLRPRCAEWGTGEARAADLLSWEYLTRRDDHEGRKEEDDHHGMIATTEILLAGTVLDGVIDYHPHISDVERSALGLGLEKLQTYGFLGADCRRGFGSCDIEVTGADSGDLYESFLEDNKESILEYLRGLGALA